jgi:hypothetical protein
VGTCRECAEMPAFADEVVRWIALNRWVFTFTHFGLKFRIESCNAVFHLSLAAELTTTDQ